MADTELNGRTVLLTGGAGGIGAAISRAFAAEGARVVSHHLAEAPAAPDGVSWEHTLPTGAEEPAAELGGVVVSADLAAPDAATRLFDATGPVDVLVNNAAHHESPDTIDTLTPDGLDRHYRVDAIAPTLLIAELARRAGRAGHHLTGVAGFRALAASRRSRPRGGRRPGRGGTPPPGPST